MELEEKACYPVPVHPEGFNPSCVLPYGLEIEHIRRSMDDFIQFIGFINQQFHAKRMPRLESFIMPANFSSIVGEFMNERVPLYCTTLARNQYHNGHPDLIPEGMFPENAIQHTTEGIEIKGSRHSSGWQGHNPESVWVMVFYFDSNAARDKNLEIPPKPFVFRAVYAARLEMDNWSFSGRSQTSRRTITASVNRSGVEKMKSNWVYKDLSQG